MSRKLKFENLTRIFNIKKIFNRWLEPSSILRGKIKFFKNPSDTLLLSKPQYQLLLESSFRLRIDEWNNWRANNLDQPVLLEGADLSCLNLQNADLSNSCLTNANLEGSDLYNASMESAWIQTARINSQTSLWKIRINRQTGRSFGTNFRGVPIEGTRIDAGTRQLIEYNIKRLNWEEWYNKGKICKRFFKKLFVKPFWSISNYGYSTSLLIISFILLVFLFSFLFVLFPESVVVNGKIGEFESILHRIYFSVVTMTTLGFGDIHANPSKDLGLLLIIFQVLSGYTLLGALITRLNILFTSGGPSIKFSSLSGNNYAAVNRTYLINNEDYIKHNITNPNEAVNIRKNIERIFKP